MLDEPNPLQTSYGFKYALITDHCVTGNALIYVSSTNRWLVQVPTEIIQMDIDGNGDHRGYFIVGVDPTSFPVGMKMKLSAKDVIHVKRPNASSVYWGMSPLIPGANPALFNKYSNEYLLNFYRKGAQPGLILEMMEETNEVQAKKLLQSLETAYTGRSNQAEEWCFQRASRRATSLILSLTSSSSPTCKTTEKPSSIFLVSQSTSYPLLTPVLSAQKNIRLL